MVRINTGGAMPDDVGKIQMPELIAEALRNAVDTKLFWIGDDMLSKAPAMFKTLFPGERACMVADRNTLSAAGREVYSSLRAAGVELVQPYIFNEPPCASIEAAETVREYLSGNKAVAVAVGSGSINDICKLASFLMGRKYMCVATAASVDGSASSGAPMTIEGFKKTVPCPAPAGIIADLLVLQRAPYDMTAAGYADLLAKVTAGADWIIADEICGDAEPIQEIPWRMVQDPLESWINHPYELKNGDPRAFSELFEGLAISGFAMQAADSSRPASGCEHMFSHVWEMAHVKQADGKEPSHGFKVGIGSLAALAAMDALFSEPFTHGDINEAAARYPAWEERERMIRGLFGNDALCEKILAESRAKHLVRDALETRLGVIADSFETLRGRVESQLMPFPRMREMLRVAGCPVRPQDIGVTPGRCAATAIAAQMLRARYTVLDLAYETGRLYEIVRRIGEAWEE